jgi:hypothetical protein
MAQGEGPVLKPHYNKKKKKNLLVNPPQKNQSTNNLHLPLWAFLILSPPPLFNASPKIPVYSSVWQGWEVEPSRRCSGYEGSCIMNEPMVL